jgi:uncharacterized membrane protein (UPF0127 family)
MTSQYRVLRNQETGEIILPRVQLCSSYWCHLVGLQFRRSLPKQEGLLFVSQIESVAASTIHMLNMFFAIAVIWINRDGVVVDKKLAKPWRLAYVPKAGAKYYLEANIHILEKVSIGDRLTFDEVVD